VADITVDGRVKVYSVPTIANRNAPTTAELNAGVSLAGTLTPDGLVGFEPDTADVDASSLNSTFGTNVPGRASFSGTLLRLKKQSGTDTIYNTLVRDFATNIVVRRDGTLESAAWGASQKVEVYPGVCGTVRNLAPEANAVQKYEVIFKINPEPNLYATTT